MGAPWNNAAPDCIQHDLPASIPFQAEIAAPFQKCFEEGGGFFTFGPGRSWAAATGQPVPEGGHIGQVIHGASFGLYTLTVIGFAVMVLVFVAFVWTEHRKLIDRAAKLRAAGGGSGAT